jgi:hypothetical protein
VPSEPERPRDDYSDPPWSPGRFFFGLNSNPHSPDSRPFANDTVLVLGGIALFFAAVIVPRYGLPLLLAYLVFLGVRWWRRSRLPYSQR